MVSVTGDTTRVEDFMAFYRRYYDDRDDSSKLLTFANEYPKDRAAFQIDWQDLYQFDADLAEDYLRAPEQVSNWAQDALGRYDLPIDKDLSDAPVRVVNLPDDVVRTPNQVSDADTGQLRAIKGQVNKRTQRRGRFTEIVYVCQRCGARTRVPQVGEDRKEPHECQGCERQGPFRPDKDESETINDQLIRVQLPPEEASGRADATLDLLLEEDLVNTVEPGDRVRVNAIVDREFRADDSTLYDFTGTANSVETEGTDFGDIDYREHIDRIKEIANSPNLFELLRETIAPTIHGHDVWKDAIALILFGGTRKELPDGTVERGDSHMLIVGDPGTGKSDLLSFADELAPRSVFTDGKGSSAAGLTASAVRDDFGESEWTVVGGSLVEADNGLACVDELDDMDPDDRAAMNTALEKQVVPVSKAGIKATLPAQTKLLAAANPKHGRFDHYDSIPEQIELDPALVSRFDLIFTVTDTVDEELDREIIGKKADVAEAGQRLARDESLSADLRSEVEPAIDPDVMRAYIAYAQDKITPVFTAEAKQRVCDEFSRIRQANADAEADPEEQAVPVTFRHQEAIHRLAEASARARLSNEITVSDVSRVVELIEQSLKDVGLDPETGDLDADMLATGSSKSQKQKRQFIYEIIGDLAGETGAPLDEVLEIAKQEGFTEQQIKHGVKKLMEKGEIYEPESEHYRQSL